MHIKALVSTIALGAALAFAGPAVAQVTINGTEVSEEDMGAVQARCDELALADSTESLAEETDSEGDSADEADEADATVDDAPEVDDLQDATTTIDLDTIDLQACVDAALVEDAP